MNNSNSDHLIIDINPNRPENSFQKWAIQQSLFLNLNLNIMNNLIEKSPPLSNQTKEEYFSFIMDQYSSYMEKTKQDEIVLKEMEQLSKMDTIKKQFSKEKTPIKNNLTKKKTFEIIKKDDKSYIIPDCPICLENKSSDLLIEVSCSHKFCKSCLFEYFKTNIMSSNLHMKCPSQNCPHKFSINEIEFISNLCSKEADILLKNYHKFLKYEEINKDPFIRWCTNPDCDTYIKGSPNNPKIICPKCNTMMCFNCLSNWHEGATCDSALELEYKKYTQNVQVKYCPKCKSKIEKNGGCNHMTCIRCKFEFCWICGCKYEGPSHFAWYNLFGCPGMGFAPAGNEVGYSRFYRCCDKILYAIGAFLIFLSMTIIFFGLLYPFILIIFGFFIPAALITKYCKLNQEEICTNCCIYAGSFLLGCICLPITIVLEIIPGTCLCCYFRNRILMSIIPMQNNPNNNL